jgi:hypothetical protein
MPILNLLQNHNLQILGVVTLYGEALSFIAITLLYLSYPLKIEFIPEITTDNKVTTRYNIKGNAKNNKQLCYTR